MKEYPLTITMTSDWHVGSGTGQAGNIDRLIKRDRSELPYIPAKTLTGIWRDACEKIALGLDSRNAEGPWHQWVAYLFGDQRALAIGAIESKPRPAAVSIRPARLPADLREVLKKKSKPFSQDDRPLLREALTFIKPGIAIDPQTGSALDDFLRYEEMARLGAVLEATYSLDESKLDKQQLAVAEALLTASASYIKRLGGKRRRGVGCCEVKTERELKSALKVIEEYIKPQKQKKSNKPPKTLPEPPSVCAAKDSGEEETAVEGNGEEETAAKDSGEWNFVELVLKLESPLLLHKRTVGNTVESLDYLPGTYLLAAIAKRLGKSQQGKKFSAAIENGDAIATHAYIEIEGTRGRPVPFAWFSQKLNPDKCYNKLLVGDSDKIPQLKGSRAGYVRSAETPKLIKVEKETTAHNTVEDKSQRPSQEVGGVYSYEAISPGTVLRSQLRVRGDLATNKWLSNLNGTYRLGRTNKDDYGLASLRVEGGWKKFPPRETAEVNNSLTVWLLSDVLLRDERLQPTVDLEDFRKELEAKLGEKPELEGQKLEGQKEEKLELKPSDKVYARQNRLESWQTRWGLPRPSLIGLAAGTCVVYEVKGTLELSKLAELEASGIGERRAEGYGQLSFNDSLLVKEEFTVSSKPSLSNSPEGESKKVLSSNSKPILDYARIVETAAWRKAIDKRVLELAADGNMRRDILGLETDIENNLFKSKPSMTQLGALRSVLRKLSKPKEPIVMGWIDSVKKVDSRRKQWSDNLEKIENLVSVKALVWEDLDLPYQELTIIPNGEKKLKNDDEMWSYAVWVLVDACIRAHKRDFEDALSKYWENESQS